MARKEHTKTKSETPSVAVTRSVLNFCCTTLILTLKMELANVTVKTRRPIATVMTHLRFVVQLFGLPGSLGPSNSTRKGFGDIGAGV